MRRWAVGLIAVLLGELSLIPQAGVTDEQRKAKREDECRAGQATELVGTQCVNAWGADGIQFHWPDLHRTDAAGIDFPFPLELKDCRSPIILKVLPDEHMARVLCPGGSPAGRSEYLVNLDALACHGGNTTTYGRRASARSHGIDVTEGDRIVARAELRMNRMQASIQRDAHVLAELATAQDPSALFRKMSEALDWIAYLQDAVRDRWRFDFDCEPLSGRPPVDSNEIRAQRSCRLLVRTYQVGVALFSAAQKDASSAAGALGPGYGPATGLPQLQAVSLRILAVQMATSTARLEQRKALGARMLLFYAMKKDFPDLPRRLELIRKAEETGLGDSTSRGKAYFWELNNGFVYGGRRLAANSGNGFDCSDFVKSILVGREDPGTPFTTVALKEAERMLAGELPARALSPEARALADCFIRIDVRGGENPQPGDLVVSNSRLLDSAHAVIVKDVLPERLIVTIEAAGGEADAVMVKLRPLFEPQPECPKRAAETAPMRPDLHVLRLKAQLPGSCPLTR